MDLPIRKPALGFAFPSPAGPQGSSGHHGYWVSLSIQYEFSIDCSFSMSAIIFLFLLDSLYNGKPTFTPINFLRTNLSSVSLFYGINSWHYYITQGIPILCTTSLPFTLHGIWTVKLASVRDTPLHTALATVLWSTAVYSLGGHKEWRFLHPILPLLHLFAAKSLVDLCSHTSRNNRRIVQDAKPSGAHAPKRQIFLARIGLPDIPTKYICLIFLTVPVSLYIMLFYRDAPISVLSYFRALPSRELGNSTVGFLMPCHSTPGFSYLHRKELANGGMWALGCEPPLQ
jgi:phosphatidylinositol glycan class B